MSHSGKAPTMPWLSPYLVVQNPKAALDFYQHAFDFKQREAITDNNGNIVHAEMTYQDAVIMCGPECEYQGIKYQSPKTLGVNPPSSLYLYCDDVDALYKKALAAGAKSISEPSLMFWGDRVCKVQDLDGHYWSFATFQPDAEVKPCPLS